MKRDKRLFDLFLVVLGLLLLWPLLLIIALLIKLDDGGPVLFLQERIGYKGRPFRIWKFRTMVVDAERIGRQITIGRDPRITRMGHVLRKFKLDELAQLVNVLRGEMSIVGPRPEVARYVMLYTPEQRQVLELVPGITDLASVAYRNETDLLGGVPEPEQTYVQEIMPEKIRTNLRYASHSSIWTDFVVIMRTVLHLAG